MIPNRTVKRSAATKVEGIENFAIEVVSLATILLFFGGTLPLVRRHDLANEDSTDDDMIVCLHSLCAYGSIDENIREARR